MDFDEFAKMMATRSDPEEEIKAAFAAFDVDGSGAISVSEVRIAEGFVRVLGPVVLHPSRPSKHSPRLTLCSSAGQTAPDQARCRD